MLENLDRNLREAHAATVAVVCRTIAMFITEGDKNRLLVLETEGLLPALVRALDFPDAAAPAAEAIGNLGKHVSLGWQHEGVLPLGSGAKV